MSPAAARVAARAVGRRNYTVFSSVRAAFRAMEPHPFERLPTTQSAARGDWGKVFKQSGTTLVFFVPTAVGVLTWPFAAQAFFDGHV
ncbi:hypothetical protein B0I35DRAFT_474618 [Stachybotrys elegans]|uniref:Uncharacterized protein n=1 Tax=Stachybotrys elegans TaxID=80388 RepID=A0A8K0T4E2_9HYPO|nr:hypothetical protein B0I35DRAFT_474618 [Stachybotrys elegans]